MKIRKYFAKKTTKQRILSCVGFAMILVFSFFIVKGNFFDKRTTSQAETSSISAENGENSNDSENQNEIRFHINWIDVGVLAALFGAYGIHKYRQKKREKRL